MPSSTVTDRLVEILATAGVKRIYGTVDDGLDDATDAIRRHAKIGSTSGATKS